MRGKVCLLLKKPPEVGITPACAGKSIYWRDEEIDEEDHPRVCGEKAVELFAQLCTQGSPPRVRGKGGLEYG